MADGVFKTLRAGMRGPTRPKADGVESDETATMAQSRSRPAWAEVDLAAITHNTRLLSRLVRPAQVCAVRRGPASSIPSKSCYTAGSRTGAVRGAGGVVP